MQLVPCKNNGVDVHARVRARSGPWGIARGVRVAMIVVSGLLLVPISAFAGRISLAWNPSPGVVEGYTIYYGTSSGSYTASVNTTQTTHTIEGLTNGVRYYFIVKAYVTSGLYSSSSNEVNGLPVTPLSFTDDPLVPGVHVMRAVHVSELRGRIDALRVLRGLGVTSWTLLVARSTVIRATHITELRNALNAVYGAMSRTEPAYTDNPLAAGTSIKAVHIAELRAAVRAVE
jgi:hypothetical protein